MANDSSVKGQAEYFMKSLCSSGILVRSIRPKINEQQRINFVLDVKAPYVKRRHLKTSGARLVDRQESSTSKIPASKHKAGRYSFRNCLVTGGASGIGYEVTKQLALEGAQHITITSRDAGKANRAIDRIRTETDLPNAPIHFMQCDFEQSIPSTLLKDSADSGRQGPFNTLINCAGITQSTGLLSTSPDKTSLILKTNLEAPIELSRQLLKEYYSHGKQITKSKTDQSDETSDTTPNSTNAPHSFCIINISSLLANRGGYGTSIYSTSKAGLIAFTRTLTLEAAAIRARYPALPPFRANVVVPGYIDTSMIETFSASHRKKLEEEIPLGRYGTPGEVAEAVMFLLENEYANNTVLNLDGGLSAV